MVLVEHAKRAVPFGDQQAAVGKKREAKRRVDIAGEHIDFEGLLL
jgi:hypothetical protein